MPRKKRISFSRELKVAISAALSAGEIIRKYYGQNVKVTHKSAEQPLTKADLEANRSIVRTLKKAFPKDGILSEEIADSPKRLRSKRVWIIDPLDGTKEFIRGIPEFAISIGLAVNQKAELGVVYNPMTRELFSATSSSGAFLNDEKILPKKFSEKIHLAISRTEKEAGEWKKYAHDFKLTPTGSIAYKMACVAAGRFDGSFTLCNKNEWDIAAGTALIHAAGGRVCQADGKEIKFNTKKHCCSHLVYGSKKTVQFVLRFLHRSPTARTLIES